MANNMKEDPTRQLEKEKLLLAIQLEKDLFIIICHVIERKL